MKVKASLHLHSLEDFKDYSIIDYSAYQLIDRAHSLGFSFLSLTGHEKNIFNDALKEYALSRDVILIPGFEANIEGKHILLLNCNLINDDDLKNLDDLKKLKLENPEIFIMAPHPNHGLFISLGLKKLEKFKFLFDGVEHSWYYTDFFNPNLKVKKVADRLSLPFIATSDLHDLRYLGSDYIEVEVADLNIKSLFGALRQGNFRNVSQPKKITELFFYNLFQIWKLFRYKLKMK